MGKMGALEETESVAADSNSSGQVVGWAMLNNGLAFHAYLYADEVVTDLGTLGGANSYARAINDLGQVVGWMETGQGDRAHAFLYSEGLVVDIGAPSMMSSRAYDINTAGQIVGWEELPSGGQRAGVASHPADESLGAARAGSAAGARTPSGAGLGLRSRPHHWCGTTPGGIHLFQTL